MLLAIRSNFEYKRIDFDIICGIDQVFVLINYNNVKLFLDCVYIPHNTHKNVYIKRCELVKNIILVHSVVNSINLIHL